MKKKILAGWGAVILSTLIPVTVAGVNHDIMDEYKTLWSFFMVPSIIIMKMYPRRMAIYGSLVFYFILGAVLEMNFADVENHSFDLTRPIVNVTIHLTIGYLIMNNQKLMKRVECLSYTDALTGINNRRFFEDYIHSSKPPLLLILIDIDHFKKINDRFGHECGDQALKHLSGIIQPHLRGTDRIARIGGEEFALMLPNTSLDDGARFAEQIRAAIESQPFFYQANTIHMTVSLGVTQLKQGQREGILRVADRALYEAKENGRNRVVVI